jgi:hypothetical protein
MGIPVHENGGRNPGRGRNDGVNQRKAHAGGLAQVGRSMRHDAIDGHHGGDLLGVEPHRALHLVTIGNQRPETPAQFGHTERGQADLVAMICHIRSTSSAPGSLK